MARATKVTVKRIAQPMSLLDQRHAVEDLAALASLAAGASDYCTATWLTRFARHLERHRKLSEKQCQIIAEARARHG